MPVNRIRKATIEDVAALANVSIKTVSRVVNQQPNVSAGTRTKVAAAIERLNYRPNLSARRLATKRTYIIALLYDNPSANYLFNIQRGVLTACNSRGYDLLVHPCDHKNPMLAEEIINLCEQGRCDGVVLTPPLTDMENITHALREQNAPFVQIAPAMRRNDYPWVATTDEQASYEITQHLIGLGHTNIGFVRGHPDHKAMTTRETGYKKALQAAGIAVNEKLVVAGYNSFESGAEAARILLDQAIPPSAIFAANDDMAAGVIKVASDRGLKIPGDLSVAGFDDTPVATQIWPALTTIRQPIKVMAEKAADILIEQLDKTHDTHPNLLIDARLVIRDSTGSAS